MHHVRPVIFVWLMAIVMVKAELNYVMVDFGELYVMIFGIHKMPKWFASNWASLPSVRQLIRGGE